MWPPYAFFALVAVVFCIEPSSGNAYAEVPATTRIIQEVSQLTPLGPPTNVRFAWYQSPYSVALLNPSGSITGKSNDERDRKIEVTKIVQGPSVVTTDTAVFLDPPPGTKIAVHSPPHVNFPLKSTNGPVRVIHNVTNKVAAPVMADVPGVTYPPTGTLFYVPDHPRIVLKPPPTYPPLSKYSSTGSSVKAYTKMTSIPYATKGATVTSSKERRKLVTVIENGVPHVFYAPANTVFHIADPPRSALMPPPTFPPADIFTATGRSVKGYSKAKSSPYITESPAKSSSNGRGGAVPVFANGLPHVLYKPANTVFHLPGPLHNALKPPRTFLPPEKFSAPVISVKTYSKWTSSPYATSSPTGAASKGRDKAVTVIANGVPHVFYAPANTVFHIAGPPRDTLKPPPAFPPPKKFSATVSSVERHSKSTSSAYVTKSSVLASTKGRDRVVTVFTNGVLHVFYEPANTVFHLSDPPRNSLKPHPPLPPPEKFSATVSSVEPYSRTASSPYDTKSSAQSSSKGGNRVVTVFANGVSQVFYAPAKTVFSIPDQPRNFLNSQPTFPPPKKFSAANTPPSHGRNPHPKQRGIFVNRPSLFHNEASSAVKTDAATFVSSPNPAKKAVRHSAESALNEHSVTTSANSGVVQISPPVRAPTLVRINQATKTAESDVAQSPTVVVLPPPTIVNVAVPTPYMYPTPHIAPKLLPKGTSKPLLPSSPNPFGLGKKSSAKNTVNSVVSSRMTTLIPATRGTRNVAMTYKGPLTTAAVSTTPRVLQLPPPPTKSLGSTSANNVTRSVLTKTTVNVTRKDTSGERGRRVSLPQLTQDTRNALLHKTPNRSSSSTEERHYFQRIETKVVGDGRRQMTSNSPVLDVANSSGAHANAVKSTVINGTYSVGSALHNMTKISPTVTVANPPAIVGVVQHGPPTLNKKPPLLVERKSGVGSARLHSREMSPSARIDSGHSVSKSTSTSTVREMKNSGFFQLATDLTSSAVQKAVKTAGSITKEAASSLTDGSGTEIIAQPIVVLDNATMQPPPPVIIF